jgi:hypothetical protein
MNENKNSQISMMEIFPGIPHFRNSTFAIIFYNIIIFCFEEFHIFCGIFTFFVEFHFLEFSQFKFL